MLWDLEIGRLSWVVRVDPILSHDPYTLRTLAGCREREMQGHNGPEKCEVRNGLRQPLLVLNREEGARTRMQMATGNHNGKGSVLPRACRRNAGLSIPRF